ncbi:uncharacterized protein LOC110464192 isoform X2 [Mizuhopecten yessoensis]|uniref:uncharacterized protein LOC110464192 isoform X2 n=1 Tax=Mizuhopecten yessoensis TaxID=6573 RepID=UPI000B45F684|nr:uncharacterized protein LOC110464192 isoform X2 [Mizuhopecten yessoensis]
MEDYLERLSYIKLKHIAPNPQGDFNHRAIVHPPPATRDDMKTPAWSRYLPDLPTTTIRDYTGGNSVEDMLEHQDSLDDGSNEIPSLPVDNIDVEMMNATGIPNMQCFEYYSCISNVEENVPPGSLKKGFYITPAFMKKQCRNTKRILNCFLAGDYSDCPVAVASFPTLLRLYNYMCVEPGRTEVMSVLPCANIYDVQRSFYTSYLTFSSAVNTIMNWPNAKPSDTSHMFCWAMKNFKDETGGFIETHCSAQDREIYDRVVDISAEPFTRQYNCYPQGNDDGH